MKRAALLIALLYILFKQQERIEIGKPR